MLNKDDLRMIKSKAERDFVNQYEKEHDKLLKQIRKNFIQSIENTDEYFQLDHKKYKKDLKEESDLNILIKYLKFKGFETYDSPDGYLNILLIENN